MRVFDAGAVVDLLIGRLDLADEFEDGVVAPHLIDSEVAHALRRLVARGVLPEDEGHDAIALYSKLAIARHSAHPLLPRIWELRHTVTAYDATYVALAEQLGAEVLTTDVRLARAPGVRCPIRVV